MWLETVILWNKGAPQSLFLNAYFGQIKIMEYNVHQWFLDVSVCLGRERILACQWIFQLVGTGLLQILCDNQIISSCCQQKWQIFIYKRSLTWIWSLVRFFSASCKRELDANSPNEKFATGKHQFEEIKIFHTKPPISTKTFEDKEGDDALQIYVGIWHSWYPCSGSQGHIFNPLSINDQEFYGV